MPGSTSYKDGKFTIKSAGANVWDVNQGFHYAFRREKVYGNLEAIVRVNSISPTHIYAKAGIMIREELDPFTPHVSMSARPYDIPNADPAIEFNWNETGKSTNDHDNGDYEAGKVPFWIKVVRKGNKFLGYKSTDGISWIFQKEAYIKMKDYLYIGLFACSLDVKKYNTAEFEGVSIKQLDTPVPASKLTETIVYEFDKKLKYTGKWVSDIGGKRTSQKKGSSATLDFYGTSVKVLIERENWSTSVDIFLDGKLEETAVLRKVNDTDYNLFERVGLKKGNHTLKIVANTNTNFNLDTIVYDNYEYKGDTVRVKVPSYITKVNGEEINNVKSENPLLTYKDVTYLPLTENYCRALGLEVIQNDGRELKIQRMADHKKSKLYEDLCSGNSLNTEYVATPVSVPVTMNNTKYDSSKSKLPLLVFRDKVYIPMTKEVAEGLLKCKVSFDKKAGFSITG